MAELRKVGPVTYREADQEYFDKRGLRRHAGVWSLWALGVAAVISGDFFGWNFGLAYGFGGLLVATVVITVMYYGLCYSISEMSPALPHTGGAYSFARSAMGPWAGFATGVAETIEYVVTPAVVVVGIGGYMNSISDDLFGFTLSQPVWWAIFYAIFVGLNFIGVVASFRFTVFICFLSLAILAVFFVGAATEVRLHPLGDRRQRRPLVHRRRARRVLRAALRDLVLPRDRGAPARGRGVRRPEEGHPARDDLGPAARSSSPAS